MRTNHSSTSSGLLLLTFVILLITSCQPQVEWRVTDYGAVGDSITVNTAAIQRAIDDCSENGGGVVLVEGGVFSTGTILLKDDVTLKVAENTKLIASLNPNHFQSIDPFIDATGQYRGQCLIGAIKAKNIAIVGEGVIDGKGDRFTMGAIKKTMVELGEELIVPRMPEVDTSKQNYVNKHIRPSYRPFLIRLVRSENINIENISLRQPAAWTLHFYQCKKFVVDGVSIYSHANQNNDGIDIDSSSEGVISNTHIDSGDDAICFKTTSPIPTKDIKVHNCKLSSHWGAVKFGTESMGNFSNITVKNCQIYDTKGGGIKLLSVDGANVRGILIDSIEMTNVDMPIFVRLGERRLVYRDAKRQPVGTMAGVQISNVTATTRTVEESRLSAPTGIFITGTPDHPIDQLSLKNIQISLPGGGTAEHAKIAVPENVNKYPEFTMFGEVLPAYGMYARHVEQLELEDVVFTLTGSDERQERIIP
ncbi:glycoside hydrolase family 28 protein [Marinoscillum furvescens]|uniref:Polygalacturonase n=1 Tax=Marinoscillum furvescens DSM 4134 TaxID=1122208 RepID=A0A3D9L6L6_MARFU|nr:glycosyl hydrolase family 28 protein [Marinoscillum furvescens]REE00217.1 polygalacturonase [Marinoscillum furvescens DSM 4134]